MAGNTGPVLRNESGEIIYTFQPSFRVEGLPRSRDVPSIQVDGRDGEVVHPELIRENSRTVTVSGTLYAQYATKAERKEAIEDEFDKILLNIRSTEEIMLCRSIEDDKFIPVYYTNIEHSYVEKTKRTIATCRFEFECYTPHKYSFEDTLINQSFDWSSLPVVQLEVENNGTDKVQPIIWINGPAVNPTIDNLETGHKIEYSGVIKNDEVLIIDPNELKVILIDENAYDGNPHYFLKPTFPSYMVTSEIGTNKIGNINDYFLAYGFELESGKNRLEPGECIIQSGTASSGGSDSITLPTAANDTSTIQTGTAQGGSTTTLQLDTEAYEQDDWYNGLVVEITSGNASGQLREITDYDGTTKTATVSAWDGAVSVSSGDTYEILEQDYYEDCYIRINTGTGEGQIRQIDTYNPATQIAAIKSNWDTVPDATSEYDILNLEISLIYRERWL